MYVNIYIFAFLYKFIYFHYKTRYMQPGPYIQFYPL